MNSSETRYSDDDGNMTFGPKAQGYGFIYYAYDAHNRLIAADGQTYRYNPDGLCVQDGSHKYVIDPNATLSRVLMRDNTCYIWGANGLEYEIDGEGTAPTKTYHPDHLGSTMLLTDANGNPIASYEYDSYGNTTSATENGANTTNPTATVFRWHGTLGVITSANGLMNMRARMYHSRLMRFLSIDPLGFGGGLNMFAFVNGNPISNVDPLGLCSLTKGLDTSWLNASNSAPRNILEETQAVMRSVIPRVNNTLSIPNDLEYEFFTYIDPSTGRVVAQDPYKGGKDGTGIEFGQLASSLPDGAIITGEAHFHGATYSMSVNVDGKAMNVWVPASMLTPKEVARQLNFSPDDRGMMQDFVNRMNGVSTYGWGQPSKGYIQATGTRWIKVDPSFQMYLGMQNGAMLRMEQSLLIYPFK